jgi:hypothetical protein
MKKWKKILIYRKYKNRKSFFRGFGE